MNVRPHLFSLLVLSACSTAVGSEDSTLSPQEELPVGASETPDSLADARVQMLDRWQTEQVAAGPAYALVRDGSAWAGQNTPAALRFMIDEDGSMQLNAARPAETDGVTGDDAHHATVRLNAWGRGGEPTPSLGSASVRADGNRVEIIHAPGTEEPIVEWYINGPHGLEHGFDIADRPAGDGDVTLQLSVAGDLELREDHDDRVSFMIDGATVLAYSGLLVRDAAGQVLTSSMHVEAGMIALHFDDTNAEYPVVVDPWFVRNELVPANAAAGIRFGTSVAIDDDTAIIGATNAVHFFVLTGGTWVEQQRIAAPAGASGFGISVAIEGDRAVVGAYFDSTRGTRAGAAYTFTRAAGTWSLEQQLLGTLTDAEDRFGTSVAIDGDTIAVGATGRATIGAGHIFVLGATWTEQATIIREGAWTVSDNFGRSVALEGDTLAMGASGENGRRGAAYVFVRDAADAWSQQARITHPTPVGSDDYGSDVGLEGERLAVGAESEETGGAAQTGTVSVYLRTGTTWTREAYLVNNLGEHRHMGARLDFVGTRIVAGAPISISRSATPGYAYVWGRVGTTWTLRTLLEVPGSVFGEYWGRDVAFSGQWAILTSRDTDINGIDSGGARAFELVLHPDGTACENTFDCESDFCIDGVCCENACGASPNDCMACSNALTGIADGSCGPIGEGSSCQDIRDTDCDGADTCDAFGRCMENIAPAGASCGSATDVPCNSADTCDGVGECDTNIAAAGVSCRPVAAGDVCDIEELCDGSDTCPTDTFVTEGTECRAAPGDCDVAEACTGVTAACPTDELVMAGVT
ncbi:MAG: hypothetical protein ACI9KE_006178, partial [Polyangiales bacterium]